LGSALIYVIQHKTGLLMPSELASSR